MPKEAQKAWIDVDQYFTEQLHLSDPLLEAAMQANAAAQLPAIDVAPNQGKFLNLLAHLTHSKRSWKSALSAATAPSGWRVLFQPEAA